jgi:hypothetical protein
MTTEAELLDLIAPLADRLERIAVALEGLVAIAKPSDLAAFHQERVTGGYQTVANGPSDPEPPYPVPVLAPSAPVPQAPFPPMQPNWQAGMVHQNGHNPLKTNSRGLYCATRMENGEWCKWHA